MMGFVWSGMVLVLVALSFCPDVTAGGRGNPSDSSMTCNMVGFVNAPTNTPVADSGYKSTSSLSAPRNT